MYPSQVASFEFFHSSFFAESLGLLLPEPPKMVDDRTLLLVITLNILYYLVVCMEKDRDNMRKAIITWLSTNLTLEGDHRSYKGLLFTYFDKYDLNKDSMLDTYEFMDMIGLEDKLSKVK